jgi:hypothetical protein
MYDYMQALLATCPNLGSLKLDGCRIDACTRPPNDPHAGYSHTQLHTLHLNGACTAWQLPRLPSLTALLIDGDQIAVDAMQHTMNQYASQLTRLRLGHVDQLSFLQPYVHGLRHNLQRLELPSVDLTDDLFNSLHDLLPGLRCVEFGRVCLKSSHADVDCGWQEMRLGSNKAPSLFQLARLPLARAGRQTRGVQRLVLASVDCWRVLDAQVAVMCSSACRLEPLPVAGKQQRHLAFTLDSQNVERALSLLACFEPDSIRNLELLISGFNFITQPAVAALGGALATTDCGGYAAVARCHTLTLAVNGRWEFNFEFLDAAACAALLPMLMATPITTVHLSSHCASVAAAWMTAVCCTESLTAVTRPITLRVEHAGCVQQAQAAINAAGKADLLHLQCDR